MKLWLDDIRPMPDDFDIWCTSASSAIECITMFSITDEKKRYITEISFDHDLGLEMNGTGYDVAEWIEEAAYYNMIPRIKWNIHSANPVGRINIETAMVNADKYWRKNNA